MHFHVGHNMPGYLPDNAPYCFQYRDQAIDFLKYELRHLRDSYYEACESYGDGIDECAWCDAATDVEAHLSGIADGEAVFYLSRHMNVVYHSYPPEGPDVVYWVYGVLGEYSQCELEEEW